MRSKLFCVQKQPQEVLYIKGVLKNFAKFTRKHLCQNLIFNKFKKEILVQMFACESCEISKSTCFTEHLWTTASLCCASDTDFSPRKDLSKTSLFGLKETLTSFHSAFRNTARSTIGSAIDFYSTSEFMSLVPTYTME